MWGALSDERTGLFTIAAGLGSDSLANHDHILLSQIRDSSNLESLAPVFILQEEGSPVIPPSTGFPFRCLLRLAGLL
jgi:hypothetical protein